MARYSVTIKRSAEAEFLAAPFPFRRQLNQKIYALKEEPRPADSQVVDGELRVVLVARWRLVYVVDDERSMITVLAVLAPAR